MKYKSRDFINAINGSGGIISTIASRVGCDWHTAKKYCTEYTTVRQAYEDEVEKTIDAAEAVVLNALQKKDVNVAKWYLTMKGAGRGYAPTNKQQITASGGITVYIPENDRD